MIRTKHFLISFFLFSISTGFCSFSQPFYFEADRSIPLIHVNLVIETGSAHDPKAKQGLAQVSTRMLLRGTKRKSKEVFFRAVEKLGARIDTQILSEGSVISATFLSENKKEFLDLLTETLTAPLFSLNELRKLQKELEGELLSLFGNDRFLVGFNHLKHFYGSHGYSNSSLGTSAGIKKITYKDVLEFYEKNYGANTIAFFGSGDGEKEELKTWFENLTQSLAKINPSSRPSPPIEAPKAPAVFKNSESTNSKIERSVWLVNKPGASQSQVLVGGVGIEALNPDLYPILIANHAFGGQSFEARLMKELRVKRGWTYGAYNKISFGKQPKHYYMWFFPKTDDTVAAIEESMLLLKDFSTKGITEAEFEFSRQSLIKSAPFEYNTAKKRVENAAEEYLLGLPKNFKRKIAENLRKVKFEEVKPAVSRHFDTKKLVITVVGNAKKLEKPLKDLKGVSNFEVKKLDL